MSARSKELRAKRHAMVADARAVLESDAKPFAEREAEYDRMMAQVDAWKVEIDKLENAEESEARALETRFQAARRDGVSTDEAGEIEVLEKSTFNTWIRRGVGALNAEQRAVYERKFQAAMGEGTDTAGGYVVPMGFYQQLIDAQLEYGGMLESSYVFDTANGVPMPIPTDNDTSNKGAILGENTTVTAQDVTFGAVTFNAYTYTSKLVLVSNQLLQDSAFNLDSFLTDKMAIRIARICNDHFTTGNGTNQPNGAVTAATLGYTCGGSTSSGETAAITYADLVELEHSVDPAYRNNARFMMHDTSLKTIKKLVDGLGRPLWLSGVAVKEEDTINGYPYRINQSMAVPAASAKCVMFGDFQNYFIRRVAGVQVLRLTERYADANQTGFLAFQRWDGNLVDAGTHPIKYLQNSAT